MSQWPGSPRKPPSWGAPLRSVGSQAPAANSAPVFRDPPGCPMYPVQHRQIRVKRADPLPPYWLQSDAPQHAGATNWELLAVIGCYRRRNLDGKTANSTKTSRNGTEIAQQQQLHACNAPPGELRFLSIFMAGGADGRSPITSIRLDCTPMAGVPWAQNHRALQRTPRTRAPRDEYC